MQRRWGTEECEEPLSILQWKLMEEFDLESSPVPLAILLTVLLKPFQALYKQQLVLYIFPAVISDKGYVKNFFLIYICKRS